MRASPNSLTTWSGRIFCESCAGQNHFVTSLRSLPWETSMQVLLTRSSVEWARPESWSGPGSPTLEWSSWVSVSCIYPYIWLSIYLIFIHTLGNMWIVVGHFDDHFDCISLKVDRSRRKRNWGINAKHPRCCNFRRQTRCLSGHGSSQAATWSQLKSRCATTSRQDLWKLEPCECIQIVCK